MESVLTDVDRLKSPKWMQVQLLSMKCHLLEYCNSGGLTEKTLLNYERTIFIKIYRGAKHAFV